MGVGIDPPSCAFRNTDPFAADGRNGGVREVAPARQRQIRIVATVARTQAGVKALVELAESINATVIDRAAA